MKFHCSSVISKPEIIAIMPGLLEYSFWTTVHVESFTTTNADAEACGSVHSTDNHTAIMAHGAWRASRLL